MDAAAPDDTETNEETEVEERKGPVGDGDTSETTATTRVRRPDAPTIAPFIYTTMLNK